MSDQTTSNPGTWNVVSTRVFDAPVESVWHAWTNSEHVKQWWGPKGFTSPLANMDVRVGGTSLVCMRAPQEYGGQDMYNTWTYSKVEPNQRLEFVMHFADKDGNQFDPATIGIPDVPNGVPHVITFKSLGDSRTEMTVTESGYATEQARDISKGGLEECLDKMAATF